MGMATRTPSLASATRNVYYSGEFGKISIGQGDQRRARVPCTADKSGTFGIGPRSGHGRSAFGDRSRPTIGSLDGGAGRNEHDPLRHPVRRPGFGAAFSIGNGDQVLRRGQNQHRTLADTAFGAKIGTVQEMPGDNGDDQRVSAGVSSWRIGRHRLRCLGFHGARRCVAMPSDPSFFQATGRLQLMGDTSVAASPGSASSDFVNDGSSEGTVIGRRRQPQPAEGRRAGLRCRVQNYAAEDMTDRHRHGRDRRLWSEPASSSRSTSTPPTFQRPSPRGEGLFPFTTNPFLGPRRISEPAAVLVLLTSLEHGSVNRAAAPFQQRPELLPPHPDRTAAALVRLSGSGRNTMRPKSDGRRPECPVGSVLVSDEDRAGAPMSRLADAATITPWRVRIPFPSIRTASSSA